MALAQLTLEELASRDADYFLHLALNNVRYRYGINDTA